MGYPQVTEKKKKKKKKNIEDICFFEVNTKYISSSELKTSEFLRVRSTSENYYVFNSRGLWLWPCKTGLSPPVTLCY